MERKADYSLTGGWSVFLLCLYRGEGMNIAKFIKDHKELDKLPFLIVFRTITVLKEMGMLKYGGDTDVEKTQ